MDIVFICICAGIVGWLIGYDMGKRVPIPPPVDFPAPDPVMVRVREYRTPRQATAQTEKWTADQKDAIEALVYIGYSKAQATQAVSKAQAQTAPEIVREVQKMLARPQLFA